jgi:hypothetical protein
LKSDRRDRPIFEVLSQMFAHSTCFPSVNIPFRPSPAILDLSRNISRALENVTKLGRDLWFLVGSQYYEPARFGAKLP